MEKTVIHHSPTREYSHAWGELTNARQNVPANLLKSRSVKTEDEQTVRDLSLVEAGSEKQTRRHFFSLTPNQRVHRRATVERGNTDSDKSAGILESRLEQIRDRLSDYHWTAETEIIDRTSDAVVHLDQMANDFRAGVRKDLESFRAENKDDSLLYRSLIDSALRRIADGSADPDQMHHAPPTETKHSSPDKKDQIFLNFLPRPDSDE